MKDSYIAISNEELEKKQRLPSFMYCNRCKDRHIVRNADKVEECEVDGELIEKHVADDTLQFVKCNDGKTFLVGINGKDLLENNRTFRSRGKK